MCKKIVFISGSRSDFGLIQSIVKRALSDSRFSPVLIRVGHSIADDLDFEDTAFDKLKIYRVITDMGIENISEDIETPLAIAQIIQQVTPLLKELTPDVLFIPGDRFEILAVALSAYYQRLVIAHIFGGDRSQGGHLDDNIRHSITKISHLHFPVCRDSYNRLIQLGEEDWRVYNYGSPVVENIRQINSTIQVIQGDYAVFTYHPITGDPLKSSEDLNVILEVLGNLDFDVYITSPNNEIGSIEILDKIALFCRKYSNLQYVGNLGWKKYLNYVKFSKFTIGNSSSNLLEAPILGVPSIDIGHRQKGRFKPDSVLSIECDSISINNAVRKVFADEVTADNGVYGEGEVSKKILDTIYDNIDSDNIKIKKITY